MEQYHNDMRSKNQVLRVWYIRRCGDFNCYFIQVHKQVLLLSLVGTEEPQVKTIFSKQFLGFDTIQNKNLSFILQLLGTKSLHKYLRWRNPLRHHHCDSRACSICIAYWEYASE